MLRPSRRIGTAELHKGAILFDIVRFTNCHRATYMSTCEKITRTKSHVYLELSAKRASVHTYGSRTRSHYHKYNVHENNVPFFKNKHIAEISKFRHFK